MDRVPSGWARCRCGFESSPIKSSTRRPSVEVYVPASRIDRKNAKVNAITFWDGEVGRKTRSAFITPILASVLFTRSLRVFYVILRLFLLAHCARFLLRSATTFFTAFFTRFLRVFFFPRTAPRPKTCQGVALPVHERERSNEKYSEVGEARRRRRLVDDPPRHPGGSS